MTHAMGAALMGAQNCFAKTNICDLQFLQFLFCVPYKLQPLTAQLQYSALIPNAIIQVCFDITKHCNKTMVL